ncbi:MAG: tRNA (N6-isopentenyl adenosine(37)-C2)-methylthiotransferase MiaB [candidate division WOR-3 bacterium]|nr:tRNA (N6-isopentenyl adenosine(37)-C2)-methylthiotransferase MiaB [candidate division WOR-3 bacterium]
MLRNKFFIKTYGCQMNLYEEGIVSSIMESAGYEPVFSENEADIIYLITCSVRQHAENRAIGRLLQLQGLKKTKPDLIIGVLGCMAQNYKEVLAQKYHADIVVGPDEYRRLPELIDNLRTNHIPQVWVNLDNECYEGIVPTIRNKVTGFISIMRGCNNFCSYCIVPYVRGRERSKSKDQIVQEINHLISSGVKDITLVGQNVLAWQSDIGQARSLDFLDLLKTVDEIEGYERLRFVTSHPKDLTPKHFEVLASLKKFCPHIHLPMQSGSNRILKLMNRQYTIEEYFEKISMGRKIIPEISFTTDVMVGFPTETESDFMETLNAVKELRFDYAYMFKYSERPQTKANEIYPKVDKQIAQQRLTKLIELQNKITEEKTNEMLGKVVEVLVEAKIGNQAKARTKTNKVVLINEPLEIGKIYQCKIISVEGWTPIGSVQVLKDNQFKEII